MTVCPNTALDKILFVEKWTPGVPMRTNKMATCVGGKGLDSSVVLSQLGVETVAIGFFSGKIGQELVDLLVEYGIKPEAVWVDGTNRVAYVIVEESTNIHSHVIVGEIVVNDAQKKEFIEKYLQWVGSASWVILAGSIPPSVNVDLYYDLVNMAKEKRVPILVDSQNAFIFHAVKAKPDIVKMNWEEFEWSFQKNAPDLDNLYLLAKEFKLENDIQNLILTMGKDGILALTTQGNYLAKAPIQKPVNAAGAGDAVSSTITWRLSMGDKWEDTLKWAAAVSAASVLTIRTGDLFMDDVKRIIQGVSVGTLK